MNTIELTPHIRFYVPAEWATLSNLGGSAVIETPDGGHLSVEAREFQKPIKPGVGSGPTSDQMLTMQVKEYGAPVRALLPGRVFASHAVLIGNPGSQRECRVWHIVNQAGAWHHETLLVIV